jgi:hypothetical protein
MSKKYNVKSTARGRGRPLKKRTCLKCDKPFTTRTEDFLCKNCHDVNKQFAPDAEGL